MKTKSLGELYRHFQGKTYFRVRHHATLADYLVCGVYMYGENCTPTTMNLMQCGGNGHTTFWDANSAVFASLSSVEEVNIMQRMSYHFVTRLIKHTYKKSEVPGVDDPDLMGEWVKYLEGGK